MSALKSLSGGMFVLALLTTVTSAQTGKLEGLVSRVSCLIEANSVVKLSSNTQGTLAKVLVKRGDRVKAGGVIAELESDVERAMYDAAQLKASSQVIIQAKAVERENADKKLERIRMLQSRDVASVQALDDARTAAALANFAWQQARLDQELAASEAQRLKAIIDRRIIRSPVNGLVIKVDLRTGEYADPATPIAVIAELQPILVEVYLPIEAYPHIRIGMQAEVSPQEPIGGKRIGQVITKDPQIDSASATFQITLKIPNDDESIPSGLRCGIRFIE